MQIHADEYFQALVNAVSRLSLENGHSKGLPEMVRDGMANAAESLKASGVMSYREMARRGGENDTGRLRIQREHRRSHSAISTRIVYRLVHDVLQTATAKKAMKTGREPLGTCFRATDILRAVVESYALVPSEEDMVKAIEQLEEDGLVVLRCRAAPEPGSSQLARFDVGLTEDGRTRALFTNVSDPNEYAQATIMFQAMSDNVLYQLLEQLSPELLATLKPAELGPRADDVQWLNKASEVTLMKDDAQDMYDHLKEAFRILRERAVPGRQGDPCTVDVNVRLIGKFAPPGQLMPGEGPSAVEPASALGSGSDGNGTAGRASLLAVLLALFLGWTVFLSARGLGLGLTSHVLPPACSRQPQDTQRASAPAPSPTTTGASRSAGFRQGFLRAGSEDGQRWTVPVGEHLPIASQGHLRWGYQVAKQGHLEPLGRLPELGRGFA